MWKGFCQDPIPPEFQDKVTLTLSFLGGHPQINEDIEQAKVSRLPWQKLHNAFRKLRPHTLADLSAEGFNVQTVKRSALHVCWCCKLTCTPFELHT